MHPRYLMHRAVYRRAHVISDDVTVRRALSHIFLIEPARHLELAPYGEQEACWPLAGSHHWYDLTVTSKEEGTFVRRVAGHVETARPSFTDPAAVAPVMSVG